MCDLFSSFQVPGTSFHDVLYEVPKPWQLVCDSSIVLCASSSGSRDVMWCHSLFCSYDTLSLPLPPSGCDWQCNWILVPVTWLPYIRVLSARATGWVSCPGSLVCDGNIPLCVPQSCSQKCLIRHITTPLSRNPGRIYDVAPTGTALQLFFLIRCSRSFDAVSLLI